MRSSRTLAHLLIAASCFLLNACAQQSTTSTTPSPSATLSPTAASSPTASVTGAATIVMGLGRFSGSTSVAIKAGQAVTFDDSTGGPHNLVTGMHGTFSAESGALGARGTGPRL